MKAEHSRETVSFDGYADDYDTPRWKLRRLAISMSHSDSIESKILLD